MKRLFRIVNLLTLFCWFFSFSPRIYAENIPITLTQVETPSSSSPVLSTPITSIKNAPMHVAFTEKREFTISARELMQDTDEYIAVSSVDEAFLSDLSDFLEKNTAAKIQSESIKKKPKKEIPEGDRFTLYVIPRWSFIKSLFSKGETWYKDNDDYEKYRTNDNKKKDIIDDWEALLGVDLYYPYYKYKLARKKFKEKFDFRAGKFKCRATYKDKKINIEFRRKF